MKTEELRELMEKSGQKGGSELNMRSEDLQQKQRVSRIPSLKKKLKKKSKVLLVLDLAIPFNPETGEEDDKFNSSHKFRPPVSETSAALMVKSYADTCEKTKNVLMKRAGITEWDTSDVDSFTDTDRKVFAKYRVPRLFTINVVSVKIPAITKDYTRDYAIKVERDKNTGNIIGEPPVALKINKLFRDKIYEQIQEFDQQCADGVVNLTEDQMKDRKREIYGSNPVSDDHPANWAEIIELPLTQKFEISGDVNLAEITSDDIKEHQVNAKYSQKLRDKVTSFMKGELEVFDKYFDFFEMDMSCPTDGDDQTKSGKMQIGLNTKFDNPAIKLVDTPNNDKLITAIRDFLDQDMNVEKEMLRSVFVSDYNEELESQLIRSLKTVFELDDKYCTEKVIMQNADIISIAFGDEGLAAIEEIDAGVSDRETGTLDEEASKQEAKTYDLTSEEFSDISAVDTEELNLD